MLRDTEYDDQIEADDEESEDEGATNGGPMDTDDMIEDLYGDDEEDEEDDTDEAVKQAWGGI
jgi:hypothetical protein